MVTIGLGRSYGSPGFPVMSRYWYASGAPEVVICTPGYAGGIKGPTGSRWTYEFPRDGVVVVETIVRAGDPIWNGRPAGWTEGLNGRPFTPWHALALADLGRRFECNPTAAVPHKQHSG
jgi:hypothetical protein